MKKLFIFLILLVLLASCEEENSWDLQSGNNDFIVVDGIITNELKAQTITLSKPVVHLNEKPVPVSGAIIQVSTTQQVHTFSEDPANPGTYISDNAFMGIKNRTYSLLITLGNKVYSAKAVLAPAVLITAIDNIRYQKNADDNLYHITKLPTSYRPVKAAMYELLLDWSGAPGFESSNPDSCKSKLYYYTLPTLDVSEVFAPTLETVTFPKGTTITERKYALTDEHAAFIRALLLETTWTGGYFNTAAANVPTNLSEGALGFFGACGVTENVEVVK